MEEKNYVLNDEGEYGKYVVSSLKPPYMPPEFVEIYKQWGTRVRWIDGDVVPGAFQMNISWYHSAPDMRPLYKHDEHSHDFDELIGFLGSNPDDPDDLGGVIEIGLNGETHRLTRSSVIFLPAGMKHLPLSIISLERPILHFSISMNSKYAYKPTDEKEAEYQQPDNN